MEIKLNLDNITYKKKPAAKEVGLLRNRLANSPVVITPDELIDAILRGQTFTPAYMTGSKAADWQSQQVIVADIDNDTPEKSLIKNHLTPLQAVDILKSYGIEPFCVYNSFSNTSTHPKFRVLLILDHIITDGEEARSITAWLASVFNAATSPDKCADTSIADNARMIYGSTKGFVYRSDSITSLDLLREHLQKAREDAQKAQALADGKVMAKTTPSAKKGNSGDYNSKDHLLYFLDFISPDNYKDWVQVGMALKAEGFTVSDWDRWSQRSYKYVPGECAIKWDTFPGASARGSIDGSYITHMAIEGGYKTKEVRKAEKEARDKAKKAEQEAAAKALPKDWDQLPDSVPEFNKYKWNRWQGVEWPDDNDAPIEPLQEVALQAPEEEIFVDPLEEFFAEIQTERFKPIPTGIRQLDRALAGGLVRKTLVTLSSAPGMGKTAISQYIFENMAKNGHSVVYVNLEMDRSQLLARSISRYAFMDNAKSSGVLLSYSQRKKPNNTTWVEYTKKFGIDYGREGAHDVTTNDILRGYDWNEAQASKIRKALEHYREDMGGRFQYITTNPENSGHITNKLADMMEKLEGIAEAYKLAGKDAPLVCVDYLQWIEYETETGKKVDTAEAIKETLRALKAFAMKYNTVVWLIMAQNRTSNQEGRAVMDAGRDTSNIEYSGDVMLSLVYTAIEDRWKRITQKKDKEGNNKKVLIDLAYILGKVDYAIKNGYEEPLISKLQCLKVTKGRGMASRGAARFIYNGKYATFDEDNGIANPYDTIPEDASQIDTVEEYYLSND